MQSIVVALLNFISLFALCGNIAPPFLLVPLAMNPVIKYNSKTKYNPVQ
jgi:hypothetical protein